MLRALNTAATGMSSQEENVNTISNNIANVNTNGYKRSRTEFEDLLYETVKEAGGRTSADTKHNIGHQIGSGSKVAGTRKVLEQGSTTVTNNPYDLMINGEGFFGILAPDGETKFTRNGAFNVDTEGFLVNSDGYKVFPGLSIPPNTMSLNISANGQVDAYVRGQTDPQTIGTIPVFNFMNPNGLKAIGGNLFAATNGSGDAIQGMGGQEKSGVIEQGMLETSNVNVMNEMTQLIKAQRAYEMNSKVMNVADQMLGTINNIR